MTQQPLQSNAESGSADGEAKGENKATPTTKAASLKQLFRYSDFADWALLALGALAVLISGANQPLQLIVFGRILDSFNSDPDPAEVQKKITFFAMVYALLGLQQFITQALQVSTFTAVAARQLRRLREKYFEALVRRPISYFDAEDSGALAASVLEATAPVANGIGEELAMLIQRLLSFLIGLGLAFYYSWLFALVISASVPVLGFIIAFANTAFNKNSQGLGRKLEETASLATETLANIRTVAAMGHEAKTIEEYEGLARDAYGQGVRLGKLKAALEGTASPVMFVMFGLGLWFGSKLIADDMEEHDFCRWVSADGQLQEPDAARCHTGGNIMTAFLSILFGFLGLVQCLPGVSALSGAKASAAKVFAVIDMPPSLMDPLALPVQEPKVPAAGKVEFCSVTFAYPSRPQTAIFKDFRLTVEAGQTVALVGPSGCGKSTVVALLERFYDPDGGVVLLDGQDLRSLNVSWLRSQIGLVMQEPILFHGTIAQNIELGKLGATQAEIEDSARIANAHDFITQFPDGYKTEVGEKGIKISGGQKQRIAIARALARNPAVLVLDEATSALDTASERTVQAALDELLRNQRRTTIVIAHRLSTIQGADKIAVIAQGTVVEEGPHQKLVSVDGSIYRALVDAQNGHETAAPASSSEAHSKGQAQTSRQDAEAKANLPEAGPADESLRAVAAPACVDEAVPTHTVPDEQSASVSSKPSPLPLKWLWRLTLGSRWHFVGGLVGALLTGTTMPAVGILMAEFIVVFFNPDTAAIRRDSFMWAMVFLGMGVVASIGAMLRQYCFAVVSEALAFEVRRKAFQNIIRQHMAWFETSPDRTAGTLTNHLSYDTLQVKALTSERAGTALSQIVVLVGGLGVAFAASWQLTLVVFAIVPGIAVPIALQAKFVTKFAERASQAVIQAGGRVAEVVLNMRTVAALGLEGYNVDVLRQDLALPERQDIRKGLASGMGGGVAASIILLGAAFKYYIGGIFYEEGIVDFPDIMRCVLVLIFMAFGMTAVSKDATDKAEAMVAARCVHELINVKSAADPLAESGALPNAPAVGRVEIVDVTFAYPARPDAMVFKHLSLTVEAGRTVALVGPSGCGKSTVVGLLERFYDPDQGCILLDGVDTKTIRLAWLRQQIGLVSQEPVLFNGTIGQNISLSQGGASQADIESSARMANAHDFVAAFPEGYDTLVGERGVQLSGGQKQRIAIARALLRNPPLLVLDEATSALDTTSERVVQAALDELLNNTSQRRTTIVIAHRLSTIQGADKIVVLSEGAVAEEGTHTELLQRPGGMYAALVAHAAAGDSEGIA